MHQTQHNRTEQNKAPALALSNRCSGRDGGKRSSVGRKEPCWFLPKVRSVASLRARAFLHGY